MKQQGGKSIRRNTAGRAAQRASFARAVGVRGVVLLEVIFALAILILGMAAVGMQVNVGLRIANNSDVATRAVMLAQSKMAELDAGIIQLVPNEELEDDFGVLYPGWAWRMYIDQTDTPDLNMITLQVLYQPGVAFREELTDFDSMTVVHTSYTLRATPANMDLQRDFGFTDEQLQEVTDSIPVPNFDPTNIDPGMIGQLDPEMLAEVLPKLMELLGANAALLNSLPQATRDQIKQAMDQAGQQTAQADGGSDDSASPRGSGAGRRPGARSPDGQDASSEGGGTRSDRLGGQGRGFDSATGFGNRRLGDRSAESGSADAPGSSGEATGPRTPRGPRAPRPGTRNPWSEDGSATGAGEDVGGARTPRGPRAPRPGSSDFSPGDAGAPGTGGDRGGPRSPFGSRTPRPGGFDRSSDDRNPRSGGTTGPRGSQPPRGPDRSRDGLSQPYRVPSERDLYKPPTMR